MIKTAVVYFSGYGHTRRIAEVVAGAAQAQLIAIDEEGGITKDAWSTLDAADAIIFGAPTYMGSAPWQFKRFADASSKAWFNRSWQDKVFGGFTVSASMNGDKQITLLGLQTLASQHGGIWVSLGLAPSNTLNASSQDVNYMGGSMGLLVQAPSDADAQAIADGSIETARLYGERVHQIATRLHRA
ncbi:flavodoxin family protein [Pseudomonas putida]|uniref:flavodoxin family protein n=1 Tax=Pseudomonas putida TaxID=303 RepID=UPI00383BD63E